MLQQISRGGLRTSLPAHFRTLVATLHWNVWNNPGILADPNAVAFQANYVPIDGMHVHSTFKRTGNEALVLDLNPARSSVFVNLDKLPEEVALVHFEAVIFGGSYNGQTFGAVHGSINLSSVDGMPTTLVQDQYSGQHQSHRLPFGSIIREADGHSWSFASGLSLLAN